MKTIVKASCFIMLFCMACQAPMPKEKSLPVKHNYIILLDLSDRIIVQPEQPLRDKEIIKAIYQLFETELKKIFI